MNEKPLTDDSLQSTQKVPHTLNGNQSTVNGSKVPINLSNFFQTHLTVIVVGFFILFAIGLVAFFYYQNQQLKSMLAKYNAPSPTPAATDSPLANWKTYVNSADGYEFKVPKEWMSVAPPPDA